MARLDGQAAIVTGAARGIGRAIALELAKAGASVVVTGRDRAAIDAVVDRIRDAGGTAEAAVCDVARYGDVAGAVDRCVATFGRLDILVNNAGVIEPVARLADSDPEEWSRVVDINLKGVYHGMRAAIPVMEGQGNGVIINISSGAAVSALEGWSHYCSTKAGVLSLTRCGDKEYGEKGLQVVGLSPGTVATDMQVAVRRSGVNPVSQLDPSVHIAPEWVGQAVVYLCAGGAADYRGTDFSLKTDEGRAAVGLPPV